jgi:aryl-alcohol dehydrogenase-like predicted oxidoreductase
VRLALGSAQFGMPYGISNVGDKVSQSEIKNILHVALNGGVDVIDTAMMYGDSESCLSKVGVSKFRLVTKLPRIPSECVDISSWIHLQFNQSLDRLNLKSVYGLLLHDPSQLLSSHGSTIYKTLLELKSLGKVEKIGISVYSPNELDKIIPHYLVDLVQAPFNVIDQRLVKSGWLRRLKSQRIEIHTRSAFLQGLLLMRFEKIPKKFFKWRELWLRWHLFLLEEKRSALEACLEFCMSYEEVDRVIVGVQDSEQLAKILQFSSRGGSLNYAQFNSFGDDELINPTNWQKL